MPVLPLREGVSGHCISMHWLVMMAPMARAEKYRRGTLSTRDPVIHVVASGGISKAARRCPR
jgi:hypothetical protein